MGIIYPSIKFSLRLPACVVMKNRFLFQQDTRYLIKTGICRHEDYLTGYTRAMQVFNALKTQVEKGEFPVVQAPFIPLDDGPDVSSFLQKENHHIRFIIIIADRESALSLRAMARLIQSWVWVNGAMPRLCFLDQSDPEAFWELMSITDPFHTGVFVFAKSQDCKQTLLYTMRYLEYWQDILTPEQIKQRFIITAFPEIKELREISQTFDLRFFPYPQEEKNLMCFSQALCFPLELCGFDIQKFRKGGALTCAQFFTGKLKTPLERIALIYAWCQAQEIPFFTAQSITSSNHVFSPLIQWMQESQSNSNGGSKGNIPQELMTVLFERNAPTERLSPDSWTHTVSLAGLAQTTLASFVHQSHKELCQSYVQKRYGVRILQVQSLNEETLGSLMMNHVIESLMLTGFDEMYIKQSREN